MFIFIIKKIAQDAAKDVVRIHGCYYIKRVAKLQIAVFLILHGLCSQHTLIHVMLFVNAGVFRR